MCLERCKTFISEKFLVGNKLQLTTVGAFSSQQAGLQSRGWGWPCPAGALVLRLSAFALGTHCHLRLFLILVIEYPPRRKKGMWVGARVQAEPSRVPPASWVMGGWPWPGLSVPATPCRSSNTYQFVPSRYFLSTNIMPLSEKQIFLFSLYIKRDKGERKEKIHLPPNPTCACISQGATFWMWEGVDFSIFPTWLLKPSFLVLLLVSQFITKWQNDHQE